MQEPHPLDGAEELGAHCQGAALAAFVKQYFSVMQFDFMKRGYLCHAGLPSSPTVLLPSFVGTHGSCSDIECLANLGQMPWIKLCT